MHSDELLVIDISTLSIIHRVRTGTGHEMASGGGHDMHDMHNMGPATAAAPAASAPSPAAPAAAPAAPAAAVPGSLASVCAPTFVSVSPDDKRLYAACNTGNTMQVWDAETLTLIKEVPTGHGAYNVEPSRDGRVVIVTNKKDQSISVFDAVTLTELARIPTTKKIVHGVAYSPDNKLAFITQESIGADPGAVDMIDLTTLKNIGTIPVPAQPTGITLWQKP
jgi:DNA-binding beta-propeller fold protein YncE